MIGAGFSGIGAGIKISSFAYSFSFAQNPGWSRVFAPGHELKQYADRCANEYTLRDHMCFNTKVGKAMFDEVNEAFPQAEWSQRQTEITRAVLVP